MLSFNDALKLRIIEPVSTHPLLFPTSFHELHPIYTLVRVTRTWVIGHLNSHKFSTFSLAWLPKPGTPPNYWNWRKFQLERTIKSYTCYWWTLGQKGEGDPHSQGAELLLEIISLLDSLVTNCSSGCLIHLFDPCSPPKRCWKQVRFAAATTATFHREASDLELFPSDAISSNID